MKLNDAGRALIGAGVDGTLVTLNPDGSPQVSLVWFALDTTPDGDELVTAHMHEYQKSRNIRRDPRVAVSIQAPVRPHEQTPYLYVRGTARVVEGGAPELLTTLAKTMLGSADQFPPADAPPGFLTRIRIERIGGIGPWAQTVGVLGR